MQIPACSSLAGGLALGTHLPVCYLQLHKYRRVITSHRMKPCNLRCQAKLHKEACSMFTEQYRDATNMQAPTSHAGEPEPTYYEAYSASSTERCHAGSYAHEHTICLGRLLLRLLTHCPSFTLTYETSSLRFSVNVQTPSTWPCSHALLGKC